MRRYSIGEACELLGTKAHILRYWEQELPWIRPRKDEFGRRSYYESDLQRLYRLKYLIAEKGMTLQGAGQKLLDDTNVESADRLAQVRELRSQLLSVAERSRSLKTRLAHAADVPSIISERSDASALTRRWKELPPPGRRRMLEQLQAVPDHWVSHITRLSGPGGLLRTSDEEKSGATPTVRLTESESAKREGERALARGAASLLWWPAPDEPPPAASPLEQLPVRSYIAVPFRSFLRWDRARARWAPSGTIKLARRFPLPELTAAGGLRIDDDGTVVLARSRLAAAVGWLTQPHERTRLLTDGVTSVGLLLPGAGFSVDSTVLGHHRLAHASVSLRLIRGRDGYRVSGPIWFDLAFLAGLARPVGPPGDEEEADSVSGEKTVTPTLTLSPLVERAAVPQLFT